MNLRATTSARRIAIDDIVAHSNPTSIPLTGQVCDTTLYPNLCFAYIDQCYHSARDRIYRNRFSTV